jgi:hypothetical protein
MTDVFAKCPCCEAKLIRSGFDYLCSGSCQFYGGTAEDIEAWIKNKHFHRRPRQILQAVLEALQEDPTPMVAGARQLLEKKTGTRYTDLVSTGGMLPASTTLELVHKLTLEDPKLPPKEKFFFVAPIFENATTLSGIAVGLTCATRVFPEGAIGYTGFGVGRGQVVAMTDDLLTALEVSGKTGMFVRCCFGNTRTPEPQAVHIVRDRADLLRAAYYYASLPELRVFNTATELTSGVAEAVVAYCKSCPEDAKTFATCPDLAARLRASGFVVEHKPARKGMLLEPLGWERGMLGRKLRIGVGDFTVLLEDRKLVSTPASIAKAIRELVMTEHGIAITLPDGAALREAVEAMVTASKEVAETTVAHRPGRMSDAFIMPFCALDISGTLLNGSEKPGVALVSKFHVGSKADTVLTERMKPVLAGVAAMVARSAAGITVGKLPVPPDTDTAAVLQWLNQIKPATIPGYPHVAQSCYDLLSDGAIVRSPTAKPLPQILYGTIGMKICVQEVLRDAATLAIRSLAVLPPDHSPAKLVQTGQGILQAIRPDWFAGSESPMPAMREYLEKVAPDYTEAIGLSVKEQAVHFRPSLHKCDPVAILDEWQSVCPDAYTNGHDIVVPVSVFRGVVQTLTLDDVREGRLT